MLVNQDFIDLFAKQGSVSVMCLTAILAFAAQTHAQAPSDPQAYCVNRSADFYPYTGEPCKSGYQLGSGNCRKSDGRIVAVPREECGAMAGTIELPFEGGRPRLDRPQAPKSMKGPDLVRNQPG